MTLFFITGNQKKFSEVHSLLPKVEQLNLDLSELQSLDPEVVIREKLLVARLLHKGSLMVEDTSLSIEGLGGLPGTFIKWFLESVGPEGVAKLAISSGKTRAVARTCIGYVCDDAEPVFFEGIIEGSIVLPRGKGFGWDIIFQPDGFTKTFGEMTFAQKNKLSMRRKAVDKLITFLEK